MFQAVEITNNIEKDVGKRWEVPTNVTSPQVS